MNRPWWECCGSEEVQIVESDGQIRGLRLGPSLQSPPFSKTFYLLLVGKVFSSMATVHSLSEIITWTRNKPLDEEVGVTSLALDYPLALCFNELDGIDAYTWSCSETYAEDEGHRYHYPDDIQEVVRRVDARYPNQAITAGQLLAILREVQDGFADRDIPLAAPVGTRVVIVAEGKDFHGDGCTCGACNGNGHSYECRIHEVFHWPLGSPSEELLDGLVENENPLYVEYAASEQAAEANCLLVCEQFGWAIA